MESNFLKSIEGLETWKNIEGFGGVYQVSDLGRVKRVRENKIMKQSKHYKGYMIATLSKNCNQKAYKVHRLVAIAFVPNPENKPQVNHKDLNKTNNKADNLEWATNRENTIHSFKLLPGSKRNLPKPTEGNMWHRAKLTADQVKGIRQQRAQGERAVILAEKYGVCLSVIYKTLSHAHYSCVS